MVRKIDIVLGKLDELKESIEGDSARKAALYDAMKADLSNVRIGVAKAQPILNGDCELDVLVHFQAKPSRISIDTNGKATMEPFLKSMISLGLLPMDEIGKINEAIANAIEQSKKLG